VSERERAVPHVADPAGLARQVAELVGERGAGRTRPLVALDHDGTLSPIAARPELAQLAHGARVALLALCEVADVAIVSGRGLDDLCARFDGIPVELVSEHGLRHRDRDGAVTLLAAGLDETILDVLRGQLADVVDADAEQVGWLVEDKGVSIAVHHRAVPAELREPTLSRVRSLLTAAADRGGHVQDGKAVLELRPEGADKGAALRVLHAAHAAPVTVMIGDDVTDEAAFEFARTAGGLGILVAEEPRSSAAQARLTDPDAVVALLTALTCGLRQGR